MTGVSNDTGGPREHRSSALKWSHPAGFAVAVATALLLIAVNGAVGFLGDEDNPANRLFAGVLAVALVGSVLARFRPIGMARAMVATAAVQGLIGAVALAGGLGSGGWKGLYEIVLGTGMFATLWLLAAWLFRRAAGRAAIADVGR